MAIDFEGLRKDPAFQKMAPEEKQALIRQMHEDERRDTQGVYGKIPGAQPDLVRPPQRTEDPLTEFNKGVRESIEWGGSGKTLTERLLPESFATKALSGVERAGWLGLGAVGAPFIGAGRVVEQATEQLPRLVGGEPESTPLSRVSAELPGLVAGAKAPTGVPAAPAPVAAGPRQALVNLANRAIFRPTPESKAAAEAGREVGIPLLISEARDSPGWAKLERAVERYPIGGGKIHDFREGQRAAQVAATQRAGEAISPTTMSPTGAGQVIKDVSRGEVQTAKVAQSARNREAGLARQAAAQGEAEGTVARLGPETTVEGVASRTKSVLEQGEEAARTEASRIYDEVGEIAGTDPMALDNVATVSKAILQDQQAMPFVGDAPVIRAAKAGEAQAAKAKRALEPPEAPPGTGDITFVGEGEPVVIRIPGMDDAFNVTEASQSQPVTFKQARLLDVKLGDMIRHSKGTTRRQLRQVQQALRKDIDAYGESRPGDLGPKLREAHEFYRTRVIEPFGDDSPIRTLLDEAEPAKIQDMLFDKRGAERLAGIKTEMDRIDPEAWKMVQRRYGDHLLDSAIDQATKTFSTRRFAQGFAQYPPEVRRLLLGDQGAQFNRLVDSYQTAARAPGAIASPIQEDAIFRAFAKKSPEAIVRRLGKLEPSEVASLKAKLGQAWAPIGRTWWEHDVLPKSHGNQSMFSRSRWLTQLKNTNPETLRDLFGQEAVGDLEKLRAVIERQEKVSPLGDNPAGTGQAIIGTDQLWKVVQLAGAIAVGKFAGITSAGAVVITPAMMARLLSSPRGIRLFTEGAMAPQGSKAAQDAAIRIGVYLSSQMSPDEQRELRPSQGGP